ncbi:Kynurenine formamidase [Ceratobasidium sp. 394]|nr:Kynurenine formamidase [Ceratobasidium sp. 394]KAG9099190.1 Kynurenine formamidase [Ceratobasidium sp. UAMH 11750]
MLFLRSLAFIVLVSVKASQLYFDTSTLNKSSAEMAKDIAYGTGPAQKLDVYLPPAGVAIGPATIVFVHGGAWRSEDKSDHEGLALRILQASNCPVIIINYQLSPYNPTDGPAVRHPAHALDVLAALSFIKGGSTKLEIPQSSLDNLYLVGHSCGAHMITSLVLLDATIATPSDLLANIKGVFLSGGLYDIDLLLAKYPTYSGFIQNAFGQHESYKHVSPAHYQLRGDCPIYWLVVHSKGDQLVNEEQAESLWERLWELYDRRAHQYVEADWERLTEKHHEMLQEVEYAAMVAQFVRETMAKGTALFLKF